MIYPYVCMVCGSEYEVDKPVEHASDEAICPLCNVAMSRIYTAPRINLCQLTLREKADITEHRIRTGAEVVCIGNERPKEFMPKPFEYDLPREIMQRLN